MSSTQDQVILTLPETVIVNNQSNLLLNFTNTGTDDLAGTYTICPSSFTSTNGNTFHYATNASQSTMPLNYLTKTTFSAGTSLDINGVIGLPKIGQLTINNIKLVSSINGVNQNYVFPTTTVNIVPDHFYFFGDSLTDTGNRSPVGHLLWPNFLANSFNVNNDANPSNEGGNNYAYGGADTGRQYDTNLLLWFGLPDQLDNLVNLQGQNLSPNSLYSILIGGNNPNISKQNGIPFTTAVQQYTAYQAIQDIRGSLLGLYKRGARQFLLHTLLDFYYNGVINISDPWIASCASYTHNYFNPYLVNLIAELNHTFASTPYPIEIILFDFAASFGALMQNKNRWGFTEIYLDGINYPNLCLPEDMTASAVQPYLTPNENNIPPTSQSHAWFWYNGHPTEAGNAYYAYCLQQSIWG
jgi:phospholipase/lecithinase/hemolysin